MGRSRLWLQMMLCKTAPGLAWRTARLVHFAQGALAPVIALITKGAVLPAIHGPFPMDQASPASSPDSWMPAGNAHGVKPYDMRHWYLSRGVGLSC